MKDIVNDLIAEQAQVDLLVADLSEDQWNEPSANCAWTIKEELQHIGEFDYAAVRMLGGGYTCVNEVADVEFSHDEIYTPKALAHLSGADTLAWWREQRTRMDVAFLDTDRKARVPWAPGLPMSAKSLASARLMELWAHSVDIGDALGMEPVVKERITSTLFLSWQARPNAYRINGLELPETPLYLEVELPSGQLWAKGEPDAENTIKGSARDWALVAVRRRNWMDTDLDVAGDEARRFASIVQTFAGEASSVAPAKNPR
ncbi:MAG: TIGR03084 family metal-binding protein [Propioniciclava sp.]